MLHLCIGRNSAVGVGTVSLEGAEAQGEVNIAQVTGGSAWPWGWRDRRSFVMVTRNKRMNVLSLTW